MRKRFSLCFIGILAALLFTPVLAAATPSVLSVFSEGGPDPASILGTVNLFRAALGDPNNANAPGPLATGRREINWDGAAGTVSGTSAVTPFTVFQNTRGATFTTPGSGLTQTPITGGTVDIAPGLPGLQANLSDINPTYATTFKTFSPLRLFTPLDSNITDGTFSVPGTAGTVAATVSGFGAVFSDVDLMNTTFIEYFAADGHSLGRFFAPPANNGLSFLGVNFLDEAVSRVQIGTGNHSLGLTDGSVNLGIVDVVVMDDFFYAEPKAAAVPEPLTLLLLGVGMAGVWLESRRRASV